MKVQYRYVFVVLVYKNITVLKDFFKSLEEKVTDYKVVLVNSYYDESSMASCRDYAIKYDCDFIAINNLGYGEGNNQGVDYVLKHYTFKYLIISNSDIIVEDLTSLDNFEIETAVIAPDTKMISGKKQNPCMWRFSSLYYRLMKISSKNDWYYGMWCAFVITRIHKIIFRLYEEINRKNIYKVFSPHGSFIVATSNAIKALHPMFNKEMFLYNEELHLGLKCQFLKIPVYFMPKLSVLHLEGASTGRNMRKVFKECAKSFLILDNAWFNKKIM